MKYRYNGTLSTVLLVEDALISISRGDVVDIDSPPSSEFILVETTKPVKTTKKKKTVSKKVKRITNADKTETSGLR
jgi:hypothetical protein